MRANSGELWGVDCAHRALPWLFVGAVAGCGQPSLAPRPSAMDPNQGPNDAVVQVKILGEDFSPLVQTDFGSKSRSTLDDRSFQAFLGDEPLENVELKDGTLHASVPAGMALGQHRLTLLDPAGREGELPDAYRVVTSAEFLKKFVFDAIGAQTAGIPFYVVLTAVDDSGRVVDGFSGNVTLSDPTGTAARVRPQDRFQEGRLRTPVTVSALAPANTLTAADDAKHTGTSNEFAVRAGPPAKLGIATSPRTPEAGQCSQSVEVQVQDALGFAAPAEAGIEVKLAAAPPERFGFFSDSGCGSAVSSLAISAGDSQATVYFKGELAGRVTVTASTDTLPSAVQSQTIVPGAPVRLAFASPEQVVKVGGCSAAVVLESVDGYGNASAVPQPLPIGLAADPAAGFSFHEDSACAAGTSSVTLAASASRATYYFRGSSSGTVTVRATPAPPSTVTAATQAEMIAP